MLVKAFATNTLTNEIIDSVDLNLPPGVITKMAQRTGLIDKVNEVVLMETINRRLAPKFREMICTGQFKNFNEKHSNKDCSTKQETNNRATTICSEAERRSAREQEVAEKSSNLPSISVASLKQQ
jgi:hypothetical protein